MERVNAGTGADEREQREALEQVQMELRAARVTLRTAGEDRSRAEGALRAAIADATTRRAQAEARLEALQGERKALEQRLEALADRLVAQAKEREVLERGAVLRDQYVDWNPADRSNAVDDGFTVGEVKVGALVLGAVLLLFIGWMALR